MSRFKTEEQKKAWGEQMRKLREAKKVVTNNILDLTKETVVDETALLERIRIMFDEGQFPDTIKVTSRQVMDILDPSTRIVNWTQYNSPFGSHTIKVIPAKEINDENN